MPHYYFHLGSPDGFSPDEIGSDFADVESAYLGACEAALEMSVEMLQQRRDPSRHGFEITNGDGAVLFDLAFSEVLRPAPRPEPPKRLLRSLQHRHRRAQRTGFEIRNQFAQTRSLLSRTRALLASPI
jgi:Domain of unknown function (DUF6894)